MIWLNNKTNLALLLSILLCVVATKEMGETSNLETITVQYDKEAGMIYYQDEIFLTTNNIIVQGDLDEDINRFNAANDEEITPESTDFYFYLLASIALTLGAGVMSGLTVGYLSIDQLELEMKLKNGTESEKAQALSVLPVLEDHHYLLVTLVLANAMCMEALPIFLDAIVPSAYAILISVVAVLFFGEIIPQAICTGPQQIRIGAALAPIIQMLKIALGIAAYPIAKILDVVLGEHMTTRYSNNDLKALIELHSYHTLEALNEVQGEQGSKETGLQPYQAKMIKSVIDFRASTVKKIMIPYNRIFTLKLTQNIDNKIAKKITKAGFSRIPVYEKDKKDKIIGIMLIKTLIGLDLTQPKSIAKLVHDGEVVLRKPIFVPPELKLETMLNQFIVGRSHMAIVTDKPNVMEKYMSSIEDYGGEINLLTPEGDIADNDTDADKEQQSDNEPAKILGLLTLEDLIEHLLKYDILDEADYDRDMSTNINPHVRVDQPLSDSLKVPNLLRDNRKKLKDLVSKQVKNNIKKTRKLTHCPERTHSSNFDHDSLAAPLLDKENGENVNREHSNKVEHQV